MRGRRGRGHRLTQWRWVALAVLLVALATGVQPQTRGWRADHAHVTLGAAVPAHTHPWDGTHHATAETANVGFADPDGIGGGAAIALPAAPSTLDRLHGVTFQVAVPVAVRASHRSNIPTPPPRA